MHLNKMKRSNMPDKEFKVMVMNMLTEVRRAIHKQSKKFSIEKIPEITEL